MTNVPMEMEAFEQTLSLQKHGDVAFFVKIPITSTNNFKKRNEILQENILIYLWKYLML